MRNESGDLFLNLNKEYLPINPNGTLLDYQQELKKYYHNQISFHFYNSTFEEYAITTPLDFIIDKDFYLTNCNEIYYVLVNKDPFFDRDDCINQQMNKSLDEVLNSSSIRGFQKEKLKDLVTGMIDNIGTYNKKLIEVKMVKNIVLNLINQLSIKEKKALELLEFKIRLLKKNLARLEEKKQDYELKIERKTKKQIKIMLFALITQILLVQYGTYYAFSWDIMEPITCLLGVIDLIIPYFFWLKTQKEYNYENLKESMVNGRKMKGIRDIIEEIGEIKENIECFNKRRIFLTEKKEVVLEEIMKKSNKI